MDLLIIRPGALGDTLMALPALVHLKGKASITFVGRRPGLEFMADHVHCPMDLEGPGWHRLFMERPDDKDLPVSHADLVVAFFKDKEGRVRENLTSSFPHTPVHVFPSFPPQGEKIHTALYVAERFRLAGLPMDPEEAFDKAMKKALLGDRGMSGERKRIVIHPGSGDPKKNLSPQFWLKLIKRLLDEDDFQGFTPTVLLGPAEEALSVFFRDHLPSIKGELFFNPLKDLLTQMLTEAALYLGHDSGITHLAAMLGLPTVALFKNSDVHQWRPLGPQVRVIRSESEEPGLIEKVVEASKAIGVAPLEK
ncbi:MAG: glycosyltransferase family 9 protein, partial [Deltaproteobacteria bacterium]|nr:glycosyltransferase family 9 protein [Deltaproteobacteria bacterium]